MQINQRFYDNLSRLLEADYSSNRNYQYQYDLAGNKLQDQTTIGITTTTTDWTYNAANQMATMQIGANPVVNMSYDNNGNLLDDGVLTYTWNRANRLITHNNGSYNTHFAYDGNGDRHQQNVGGTITNYLNDVGVGLTQVLSQTTGANTDTFVHGLHGMHSMHNQAGDWSYALHDGLGSVRAEISATGSVVSSQNYSPYGQPFDTTGTPETPFAFTGQMLDDSGLQYHRARYYNPSMGNWASQDFLETPNRYNYADANPVMMTDPNGLQACTMGYQPNPQYPSDPSQPQCVPADWVGSEEARNYGLIGDIREFGAGMQILNREFWTQMSARWNYATYFTRASLGFEKQLEGMSQLGHSVEAGFGFLNFMTLGIAGNLRISGEEAASRTAYYGQMSLGWRPIPEGMNNWSVAAESVLGVADLASGSSFSTFRRGIESCNPLDVIFGLLGITGFTKAIQGGHTLLKNVSTVIRNSILSPTATAVSRIPTVIDAGKWDYLFGRVSSNSHNLERSLSNAMHMERLGLADDVTGYNTLSQHFDDIVQNPSNITRSWTNEWGLFETRESLFQGSSGAFAKFESTWEVMDDGTRRLTTAIPTGGSSFEGSFMTGIDQFGQNVRFKTRLETSGVNIFGRGFRIER